MINWQCNNRISIYFRVWKMRRSLGCGITSGFLLSARAESCTRCLEISLSRSFHIRQPHRGSRNQHDSLVSFDSLAVIGWVSPPQKRAAWWLVNKCRSDRVWLNCVSCHRENAQRRRKERREKKRQTFLPTPVRSMSSTYQA